MDGKKDKSVRKKKREGVGEAWGRILRSPQFRMAALVFVAGMVAVALSPAAYAQQQSQSYFEKPLLELWNQWKGGVKLIITLFLSWSAVGMYRGEMFAKESLVIGGIAGAVMFYAKDLVDMIFK